MHRTRAIVTGLAIAALAACGDPATAPDAVPAIDATPSLFPPTITVPAGQASITNPFDTTIIGTAAAPIGSVALTHDAGAVALDGTSLAFVYEQQPFGDYTLYQGFALGPARWDVFWAYCMNGALVDVYDEGIGGPGLFVRSATGTCAIDSTPVTAPVPLPAMTINAPTPFTGYTVEGPAISIHHDGTGWVEVAGAHLPLIVFGDVNCSGCGGPGWYELHAVLWDPQAQRAIFVIIYLELAEPGAVLMTYARTLPDLDDPIGTRTLTATWTLAAPHLRANLAGAPRFGMPPPTRRP